MIGRTPLTAADLDLESVLAPTLTPPMTTIFKQVCDSAHNHILEAKWRQKLYGIPCRVTAYLNLPRNASILVEGCPKDPRFDPEELQLAGCLHPAAMAAGKSTRLTKS